MTWFKCGGGGGGIPAALKSLMNSVFNKKFGTAEIYPPETWPDTVNLMGPLEEKTVSGSIVTFSDGSDDVPLKSCEVTIPANLDGVSSVDVVQCGANIWNEQWETGSYNTDTGEPGYSSTRIRSKDDIYVKGVTSIYIVSPENVRCIFMDENKTVLGSPSAVHNGVVTPTTGAVYMRWYTGAGYGGTYNNDISFNLDITDTVYHAYNGTTHTASLGRTIHGGSADIVNGTGTGTHKRVKFSDLEWTRDLRGDNPIFMSATIADMKIYSRGELPSIVANGFTIRTSHSRSVLASQMSDNEMTALENYGIIVFRYDSATSKEDMLEALGNEYITYPLATAEDFTFTPVPINSRLADNTMWGDGDLEVVYRSSGTQTIIQPTLISKTITENGTYTASADNADGYSSVTVNVPTGTTEPFKVLSINGTAGTETFTADNAGTYMFLVGTSAQGSASITSSVTPDLTFSKQSSDNRGLFGAIYTLGVGDTVTMTNSVVSWVYNTKVVVEMNISVSAVIDSSIVNDGTLPTFTPSISGNALFISMAGGRSGDNSYDRTYTDLNSFEFFGKVETGIFLRIRYGSTVPNYQLYGYDGGCALAIALSVNNPPVLLMGGFNSSSEPEIESENSNDNEEDPINE